MVEMGMEACLECEAIHDVELAPHDYTGSFHLGLFQSELA